VREKGGLEGFPMRPLSYALMAAAAALATATTASAAPATVVSATFGLFAPPGSNTAPFTSTNLVPRTANTNYGWLMVVRTDKPTVHWREEFTLPAPAATWGTDGGAKVSTDRKVAVTERDEAPQDGLIMNVWTVAPDDPAGHYVIKVSVDGGPEQRFDFDVQ
jgi:hypothetical protein